MKQTDYFANTLEIMRSQAGKENFKYFSSKNTVIGVLSTNAKLNVEQVNKLAQTAQDGLARVIRPAHTMFDGDTIFCLATGEKEMPATPGFFAAPKAQCLNEIGHAAADCVSRAIIHAILNAHSIAGMIAFCDLEDR